MKTLTAITCVILGSLVLLLNTANSQNATDTKMNTETKAPTNPTEPVKKSDAEWKEQLTEAQYRIARKHGTEAPNGRIYKEFKKQGAGSYYCVGCGAHLFDSETKFDARCGWPAFYDAADHKNIKTIEDFSAGMKRVEVRCNICDAHLGHVFEGEGFNTPTDQRYCINGTVLTFVPKTEKKPVNDGKDNTAKPSK